MNFSHGLKLLDTINNQQLREIFKCGPQGGMRRSHKTNTLVIVSDHTKAIYEDRWVGDILHYTGMGMRGDQSLEFAQNKTLAESRVNGVEVYLFEVFQKGNYTYRGQVELTDDQYQEDQPDIDDNIRTVWVFLLKLMGEAYSVPLPEEMVARKQEKKEKEARRLSDEELEIRARYSRKGVGARQITTTTYERNIYVSELAKRKAGGICQLCAEPAPFSDKKGSPYLETHHIDWLSKGGEDIIENTVALCPNCHRKMHSLNLKSDQVRLKARAQMSA